MMIIIMMVYSRIQDQFNVEFFRDLYWDHYYVRLLAILVYLTHLYVIGIFPIVKLYCLLYVNVLYIMISFIFMKRIKIIIITIHYAPSPPTFIYRVNVNYPYVSTLSLGGGNVLYMFLRNT